MVKEHYKNINGIQNRINKAVSNIKRYITDLKLYDYIKYLRENRKQSFSFYKNIRVKTHENIYDEDYVPYKGATYLAIDSARIKGVYPSPRCMEMHNVVLIGPDLYAIFKDQKGGETIYQLNYDMSVKRIIHGDDTSYTLFNCNNKDEYTKFIYTNVMIKTILTLLIRKKI